MHSHPFILLTGHRKGGTTMFHSLFDSHESVCTYPVDLTVLYAYSPHFIKENDQREILINRLEKVVIDPLQAKLKLHDLDTDIEQFRKIFRSKIDAIDDLKNLKAIILAMTSTWSELNGFDTSQPMVLKETSVDIYADSLFSWFPDMRIVQIVRDPRDNYAALKAGVSKYYSKMGENELTTLASLINRASIDMKMALTNPLIFGDERYKTIRFEDVVGNTEKVMRDVSAFLKIPFHESLLAPTFFGVSSVSNNFEGKTMNQVSSENLSRWKQRITPEEAQIIEFSFKGLMEQFHYLPEYSEAESAQAFSEFYKWSNYHYFFHDPFAVQSQP